MRGRLKRIFLYKPYWPYIVADIVLLAISVFIVLQCFPLVTPVPWIKYDVAIIVFSVLWLLCGYMAHRYVSVKYLKLLVHIGRLLLTTAVVFCISYGFIWLFPDNNYSVRVLSVIISAVFITNLFVLALSYAYKYALNTDPNIEYLEPRESQSVLYPAMQITEQSKADRRQIIEEMYSAHVLNYISQYVNLYSTNTSLLATHNLFDFKTLEYYRYDAILNLYPLNNIRGINQMYGIINNKLPDDGLFVCCFEPKSVHKKHILDKYPIGLNYLVYIIDFIVKRVFPKLIPTSRLYFDITEGKNRVLSKAEILGRLCYCGFEIVDERKIKNMVYVIARRSFSPKTVRKRIYGIFIKLRRIGKNGKTFHVYKMRTMHPYSEFLQDYIYKQNSLQEGGKFNHDIRVTTLGRFMRRCWIDELPMLINLLKGDMKLVGVRPISMQYFNLYTKELQIERIKYRPGLLPPFYADMPKTIEDIEASEMKYLNTCKQKGVLKTDFIYFWKILYNILIKRERSH